MNEERLDLVIFGATGFTGKSTVKEAARLAKDKTFTWGIAGRRKEALESILKEFAPEAENVRIIIADLKDQESLNKMTEQAKVLVNCAGPYRFYGEPVIKACIASKTHHVDISGEPQYQEKIQLDYDKTAQEVGVYIVSACGFDSIPCDLGVVYVESKFDGEVNSVESYINTWTTVDVGGPSLYYGTWESAVYGAAHLGELRDLREKLYPQKLPELKPKLKIKYLVHRTDISPGWSVLFPGSDRDVVYRSQRFLYEKYKQRPIQVETYITLKITVAFTVKNPVILFCVSFPRMLVLALVGGVFLLFSKFKCGRSLLLKYPKLFSAGLISHEDPKPELIENTHFSVTFIARGWTEKLAEPTDQHEKPPNKELIAKVSGVNPGYGATCTSLLISALTILRESDKMPDKGGVLTPGAAFAKTSIIEELTKNGLKFEILSTNEK